VNPAALDAVDRHIVNALQANARMSNADIARDLSMAPSAILERIRKLEQRGIITGYEARVAPKALGLGLTAFVFARFTATGGGAETDRALATIPEVSEIHHVAGEDCLLVKVRVRDTDDLARVLGQIKQQPDLTQTRTTIVLSTAKESSLIAIPPETA
jgi:Lrp/AsnC family leucine-responsive transcriptional regulator